MILYHGSRKGIEGRISPVYRSLHSGVPVKLDFGEGFYCGTRKDSAVEWVINNIKTASLSVFNVDEKLMTDTFRVHRFEQTPHGSMEWALFVAYNRGWFQNPYIGMDGKTYDPREVFPRTFEYLAGLNDCDVIVGDIADDRMQEAFGGFLNNDIGLDTLCECLRISELGVQYTFKTQRSCGMLNDRFLTRTVPLPLFLATDPDFSSISPRDIAERKKQKYVQMTRKFSVVRRTNWGNPGSTNFDAALKQFEAALHQDKEPESVGFRL